MEVVILYPKGGVSHVQEQQLTTMGKNVRALEVAGNFDDCQRLVKEAFLDKSLNENLNLMSANSINIGRVIPQSFYYAWTSLLLQKFNKPIVFSVPSGNFGNITGGLWAQKMGFPIHKFVAANNANHPFYKFLKTGVFAPLPSVPTISNAMDIGHPNNYYRISHLFGEDVEAMRKKIFATHFSDEETKLQIQKTFDKYNYVICPHTAVGLLGTSVFQEKFGNNFTFVTVSTAHPAKFPETVEDIIKQKIEIPENLQSALNKNKEATLLKPTLKDLKMFL